MGPLKEPAMLALSGSSVLLMKYRAAWLVLVLAVGCSGSGTPETTSAPTSSSAPPATSQPTPTGTIPPFVEVEVATAEGPVGTYLVDAAGRSLYLFTLDDERTSSCEGPCAVAWPPFYGDGVAGAGVDQALLGNAERSDGSIQVTYGGHPLYYYAEDSRPGDAKGHGFNEVWYLVSPDGNALGG